ncbi:MAG: DUF2116 family Zn-ribbon domain-containing protein [Candidatus Methanoplasma sp.]|jgi:predicted nucleic acid-binding Zn ribbon protein|nr:DUF2116 family Zn-ribbon domain-containing protein [Candidatus Methanoplasma sp.]
MPANLPEHDHCRFCGDPVPFDMLYCKMECYHAYQAQLKQERNKNILFVVLSVVSVIVIGAVGVLL